MHEGKYVTSGGEIRHVEQRVEHVCHRRFALCIRHVEQWTTAIQTPGTPYMPTVNTTEMEQYKPGSHIIIIYIFS